MNPVRFKCVYGSTWPYHLYDDFWKHYWVNTYVKPELMHMLRFYFPVSAPSRAIMLDKMFNATLWLMLTLLLTFIIWEVMA